VESGKERKSTEGLPPLRPITDYWLTRALSLRALAGIYGVAFLILTFQCRGLFGAHGILPARTFLLYVHERLGARAFLELPGLFWLDCSDGVLLAGSLLGLGLSVVAIAGYGTALVFAALWLLQLSFVSVGQIFYGYGWELLLLEMGFLAIFTAPRIARPRTAPFPPSPALLVLHRWVLFRVLLGAGLIKLRGDDCWTALTCLATHYETQPNPGPLSQYFHALPMLAHRGGVLFNHFVELVVPFGLFLPRRIRILSGLLAIAFQTVLILSGNLSFLNWLTIVVALTAFDDPGFRRCLPGALVRRIHEAGEAARRSAYESTARKRTIVGLLVVIGALSIAPALNLVLPNQAMNASFDPLRLVNTYGAFGSVDKERHEVVLEGTRGDPASRDVVWEEYEFPGKPGSVERRPRWVTPYHFRLDWQMWFAGHRQRAGDTWFFKFVIELLRGNRTVTGLLSHDPFRVSSGAAPPRYIRALLYRYRFLPPGSKAVWSRDLLGEYLRPVSLDDADVQAFLSERPWLEGGE
jgi:hypothetical protein